MSWGIALAIGLMLALTGYIVYAVLNAEEEFQIEIARWKMLLGAVPIQYTGDVEEVTIAQAMSFAVEALGGFGPWPSDVLRAALRDTKIKVVPNKGWRNTEGVHVGGQSVPDMKMIQVGPQLTALAHELAHVAQWWIDHRVDYEHATWMELGITKADSVFRAKLAAWMSARGKRML